jgi:thiamine biosynthesis lipoprotein
MLSRKDQNWRRRKFVCETSKTLGFQSTLTSIEKPMISHFSSAEIHGVPRRLVNTCAFAAVLALPVIAGEPEPRGVVYPTRVMGTYANVLLVTPDSVASAPVAAIAHRALARVDSLMSNWTGTSEVARINREAGRNTVTVNPEVARVLDASLRLWKDTKGAFDITVEPLVRVWGFIGGQRRVPTEAEIQAAFRRVGAQRVRFDAAKRTIHFTRDSVRIDLGGIAKGYAVDVAAESLAAHGVKNALVDLTGNMVALGHPANAPAWRIGVRDPRDRIRFFARVPLEAGEAISTSGQYEQFVESKGKTYGHIIDPRTGKPAEGLLSVTLIGRSALDCDSWDTPLFVLGGRESKRLAAERTDIHAILVAPGDHGVDTVWVEESLRARFTLVPEARDLFHVIYF